MSHHVFIGLGSNLGDRKSNIIEAQERISGLPDTRIVKASSLYESEPHGDARTWFVNSVVEIVTEFDPAVLLSKLRAVEKAMGRKRVKGKRWGSRVIDLDILLYDHQVIAKRNLKVPHPRLHERKFVLAPLSELAPELTHPQLGMSISEALGAVKDTKKVMLLRP